MDILDLGLPLSVSLPFWGLVLSMGLMLLFWLIHLPLRNAGLVDVGWALGLGLVGLFYSSFGDGYPLRRILLGVMVGFWAFRLAGHFLLSRVGKREEGRYTDLREAWGRGAWRYFFLYFLFQGIMVVLLALPFLFICLNEKPGLQLNEQIAAVLWCVGLLGEWFSDRQLKRFRRNPDNQGLTLDRGLWRLSRHPNYFFEWLIWMAYGLMALSAPLGFIGLVSPALMLFFLLKVSGIPSAEAQALKSRGDDYKRYQRTTSPFFPWFPRRDPLED